MNSGLISVLVRFHKNEAFNFMTWNRVHNSQEATCLTTIVWQLKISDIRQNCPQSPDLFSASSSDQIRTERLRTEAIPELQIMLNAMKMYKSWFKSKNKTQLHTELTASGKNGLKLFYLCYFYNKTLIKSKMITKVFLIIAMFSFIQQTNLCTTWRLVGLIRLNLKPECKKKI